VWVLSLWNTATVERSAVWNAAVPADPAVNTLAPTILAAIDKLGE
jgi:hypothetical protein